MVWRILGILKIHFKFADGILKKKNENIGLHSSWNSEELFQSYCMYQSYKNVILREDAFQVEQI